MGPVVHSGAYTAAVSGASGFIGTELVKQLLEKGYDVKGTVRDTSNTEKTAHLTKLAEVGSHTQCMCTPYSLLDIWSTVSCCIRSVCIHTTCYL